MMSKVSAISRLPESPDTMSPSPSPQPSDWSCLLKPLSAFPTPPDSLGSESWEAESAFIRKSALIASKWQTPTITASACFLKSLLPSSCRVPKASTLLPEILHKGQHLFTPYTIAMAGCILDALSSKFCHTLAQNAVIPKSRPTFSSSSSSGSIGELIISTALVISTKFLNDRPPHNIHFQIHIFGNIFSTNMLSVTERCMLEDINYRLGYLCAECVVGEKMGKLEKAIESEKKKEGFNEDGWEELEFELEIEELRDDDVVDESRMLAVFELDEDFNYDDDDD